MLEKISKERNSVLVSDAQSLKQLLDVQRHHTRIRKSQVHSSVSSGEVSPMKRVGPTIEIEEVDRPKATSFSLFRQVSQRLVKKSIYGSSSSSNSTPMSSNLTYCPKKQAVFSKIELYAPKQKSFDVLSESHLAYTHGRIDQAFNKTPNVDDLEGQKFEN